MFGSGILPDKHTSILGIFLLAGLLWVAVQDFFIFHTLISMFTLVAIWGIFLTSWNSRRMVRNAYFSFVGIAYLFVGLVEILHILSFRNMVLFTGEANQSAQLEAISLGMQAAALVAAPLLQGRKFTTSVAFASFGTITAGSLLSVLYWHNFPLFFVEGIGLTYFERLSHYAIILLFITAMVILSLKRKEFEFGAFCALLASLALSGLSELSVASYTAWINALGHFLKLIAVYLMYRVFLKTGIFALFNRISQNLKLSEKNLFSLLEGLPAFVFVQMPDYTIRYANRVFRELFGEPVGRACYEVLKGESEPCAVCPTREILRTGVPHNRDWNVINDKTYAIYEYPYYGLDDSAAVLKLGIDITERKNMERELIAARNELEDRVRERTSELTRTNEILRFEIDHRERAQIELEQSEEERRLLSRKLLDAQEMERKRIAMELHDSLGGSIAAIKFRTEYAISQMDQAANAKSRGLFNDIVGMLKNLVEEVRRIHSNIWPSVLSDCGLVMAIDWFCRRYEETYPHISIEKSLQLEETDVPDSLKIVIFRIIQEALNNIAKHSGANLAALWLGMEDGAIGVKISDDGNGFDLVKTRETIAIGTGVGLSSMSERARLSGGSLEIRSGESGTEIRALWPLEMISTK
ncbi:membrane hypothetical protein [Syntrophobacter sp. SbD1]|nr:membrane hypothetical protein [Syntrophobacter sp. SbD1]